MRIPSRKPDPGEHPPAPLSADDSAAYFALAFHRDSRGLADRWRHFVECRVEMAAVDDVLQMASIGLWDGYYAKGVIPTDSVEKLFFRILCRRIADHVRRSAKRRATPEDAGYVEYVSDTIDRVRRQTDTEHVADRDLQVERLRQLIAELPTHSRVIIDLISEKGYKPSEAAAALGISANTARVRVHRAMQWLRARLEQPGTHPGGAPDGPGGKAT